MVFTAVIEYIQGNEAKNSYSFVLPSTGLSLILLFLSRIVSPFPPPDCFLVIFCFSI